MKEEIKGKAMATVDTVNPLKVLSKPELKAAKSLIKYVQEKDYLFNSIYSYYCHANLAVAMIDRYLALGADDEFKFQMKLARDVKDNFDINPDLVEEYKKLCNGLTANSFHKFGSEFAFCYTDTFGLDKLSVTVEAMNIFVIDVLKKAFKYVSPYKIPSYDEMGTPSKYRVTHKKLIDKILAERERDATVAAEMKLAAANNEVEENATVDAETELAGYEIPTNAVEILNEMSEQATDTALSTAYEMLAELVSFKFDGDAATQRLLKEGVITDTDTVTIDENEKINCATLNFDADGEDYRVKYAWTMINEAGLDAEEFIIENRVNLHYFQVGLNGLKKLARHYLPIDAVSAKVTDVTNTPIETVNATNAPVETAEIKMVDYEDDGSNDDPDEEESVVDTLKFNFADDELVDRYAIWKDKVTPYTYHVLALNIQGALTFDGKRISKENAAAEVAKAHNCGYGKKYKDLRAILLTDEGVSHYLSNHGRVMYRRIYEGGNVRIVDFGRDEIPYINLKVDGIIAYYQAKAEAEDEEKAREIAYKASLEYKLEKVGNYIEDYEDEISYHARRIKGISQNIVSYLKCIAGMEDEILKHGLEIDSLKAKLAAVQAQKKKLSDEIATRDAYIAINAAAVDIEDDGSNDDDDENFTVDYTVDVEENDDDELVDPPIETNAQGAAMKDVTDEVVANFEEHIQAAMFIFKISMAMLSVSMTKKDAPVTFDLQQFNDAVSITDSPAPIDTTVTLTATPMLSEDTELDAAAQELFSKVKETNAEVEEIEAQIAALNARREKILTAAYKLKSSVLYEFINRTVKFGERNIIVKTPSGNRYRWGASDLDYIFLEVRADKTIRLSYNHAISYDTCIEKDIATYDWKSFKAAMRGLAAAIDNCDEEYIFPADSDNK